MKNKKIIRLTENDIHKLVKKIINENLGQEERLINKSVDLLSGYFGYDPRELPMDLKGLHGILWQEFQQRKGDGIMSRKIDDLIFEIESVLGYYDDEEYEEGYDHLLGPEDEID